MMRSNPRYWPEAAALLDWGFRAKAAGVPPVGQLVDPLDTPEPQPSPTAVAAQKQVATAATTQRSGGLPLLPATSVAAGLAVMGSGFLRSRRRGRGKMKLPPI
jgi:hypothetical protein